MQSVRRSEVNIMTLTENEYNNEVEFLVEVTLDEIADELEYDYDPGDLVHEAVTETVEWHDWFVNRQDPSLYLSIIEHTAGDVEGAWSIGQQKDTFTEAIKTIAFFAFRDHVYYDAYDEAWEIVRS